KISSISPGRRISKAIHPPQAVVKDILSQPEWPFPTLNAIAHAPFFAPNGRLVSESGYNRDAEVFLEFEKTLDVPQVSAVPKSLELEQAKELIFKELFGDFPFVNGSDRAHALGAIVSPFVVPIVDAPMPLHLLEARSWNGQESFG